MADFEITAEPGVPQILTTREFDAPRELVYRAFTEPDLLGQWLGPRRYGLKVDEYDLRHGGRWRYLNIDDGGNEFGFHGVFHGEPSFDGIVQTFEFEGAPGNVQMDTVTFEDRDGRTIVSTNSVFQSTQARDAMYEAGMSDGMREGYERLEELLEKTLANG